MPVLINGRTAVHAGSEGTLTTQDTCYTGPSNQPITYQNIAKSADAENTAKTVFINGHPVCHKESYFAKSYGSEAGNSGINSGTIGGKAEFITASSNVFIEGIPAVRQGDIMVSNNRNTPPAPLMQKGVPYSGDKDKINKFPKMPYPKLEFDLSDLPLMHFEKIYFTVTKSITVALNGIISLQKEGTTNPLTFDLDGYKISARRSLSNYFNYLTILSVENSRAGIGSTITGEYWTSNVKFQQPNRWIFECSPQPLNKEFQGWKIGGDIGYQLTVEDNQIPPLPVIIDAPEILLGRQAAIYVLNFIIETIGVIWIST